MTDPTSVAENPECRSTPGAERRAAPVILIGWPSDRALCDLDARAPGALVAVFEPGPAPAGPGWTTRVEAGRWSAAGRLVVLAAPDYAGAAEAARRFPDLERAEVIVHPGVGAEAEAQARLAIARLRFGTAANDGARRASAARYLLHTLMNVPRLARESRIDGLAGLLEGIPAVVVAAGPSLDRNIHDLAVVRDRPVIIACDTAARPLLSVGVEPDLIVASDSSRANAGHLSSLPSSTSWLVAEGSLHPSAFAHFDGRTFFFRVADHEPWPWLHTIGLDAAVLPTWGSVATSAVSLALTLGCGPIGLIGADFAFTEGRPYCRGTSFEPLWSSWIAGGRTLDDVWQVLLDRWPPTSAVDLRGQPVRTAPHLLSFRDWVVERVQANPSCEIVNATGAGVLAGPGVTQRSLTATLADAPPLDRSLLHQVLRLAHASHRNDAGAVFDGIDALLAGRHDAELAAMIAFGAPGVGLPAIHASLQSHEYAAWALGRRRAGEDPS